MTLNHGNPYFKYIAQKNKKKVVVCAGGEETGGGMLTYYVEALTRGGEDLVRPTITRKMCIESKPDKTRNTVSNEGLSLSSPWGLFRDSMVKSHLHRLASSPVMT
jgi:hypothetical protein